MPRLFGKVGPYNECELIIYAYTLVRIFHSSAELLAYRIGTWVIVVAYFVMIAVHSYFLYLIVLCYKYVRDVQAKECCHEALRQAEQQQLMTEK